MISANPELMAWIDSQVDQQYVNHELKFKVACILHGKPTCINGNTKQYHNFLQGWRFCNRAGQCQCANQQVSQSVSISKQAQTALQKQITNQKREETNLLRYNVSNSGQSQAARAKHTEFYNIDENVKTAVLSQQTTLMAKYGVSNPRHIPGVNDKIRDTVLAKFGVSNPMQNTDVKNKSIVSRAQQFNPAELYRKNFPKFCEMVTNNWEVIVLTLVSDYHGVASRPLMQFKCTRCGYCFEKRFDYAAPPSCIQCNPSKFKYVSGEEQQVFDFIKSIYSGVIIQGDRSVITPFQLDIYLPELNLAIEYCGLYWHSELGGHKSWNYHQKKLQLCQGQNIRLITLFSDEWNLKKVQTQSKLRDVLGLNSHKVFARKCQVQQLESSTAKSFYDQYHIQGSPKYLGYSLGLYHNGELISVMSFKRKSTDEYELVRFASALRVVGGASKLFSHFVTNLAPQTVYSFADLRWSQGNLYYTLGFTLGSTVPPMQSYVENYSHRYHKLQFSKSKICEEFSTQTEWQRMQELGFDRIWDCGKLKFVWRAA